MSVGATIVLDKSESHPDGREGRGDLSKIRRVMERYAELRADPNEWASYQAEARLTDQVAGEGLPDAGDEYPEYNR